MHRRAFAVAAIAALGALGACNPDDVVHRVGWFADMRHQRNIRPYARPIPPPEGAVPVTGADLPLDAETAPRLINPRATTVESLERGRWAYDTYCAVCHGADGRGDGPLSLAGGGPFPAIPTLVDADRRALSDGHFYAVVVDAQSMGKGLMPRYGYAIRDSTRWDLVNYVRLLQGRAAAPGSAP